MAHTTSRFFSQWNRRLVQGIPWLTLLEIALIAAWALWVGRNLLNFDRTMMLTGREFGMSIQSHFVWQWFSRCNLCVFWDGSINGGAPAFTELQGAVLHPVVVVTSLLFGAINGAKITLIITLFMAGFAQWWLARVMQAEPASAPLGGRAGRGCRQPLWAYGVRFAGRIVVDRGLCVNSGTRLKTGFNW